MRRWVVAAVGVAVPLTAHAQLAAPPPFHLRWSAPATCPAEAEVAQEAQRLLGSSTAAALSVPIEAEARVISAKSGFELLLRVGSSEQARTRNLEAPSCDELAHAAALVVALAVDPSLSLAETDRSGSATPSASAPLCPEPAPPVAPAPPAPCPACASCPSPPPAPRQTPGSPWHTAFVAGTSIAYGELPQLLLRPNLGVGYRTQAYWFEVSAGAGFASSGRLAGGRVATFSQWYATPRFCIEPNLGWARLGACALAEVGALKSSGFGVTSPRTKRGGWVAPGLGLQVSRRMASGAELVLGVDAMLAALRPRFELASQPFFTPHLIIPALRLGLIGGLF